MTTIFHDIDEFCQQGLNSSKPKHWEAALQDILDYVRRPENSASRLLAAAKLAHSALRDHVQYEDDEGSLEGDAFRALDAIEEVRS